ncbi:uncharacterized protein Dvar_64300 [Desulfosarcina variabilis str. Montpellier]|uniref:hypothetical protein n=1 Tax=Desulfosarcina variabilis TaxID=2300 RepID=UPI003AFB5F92
MLRAILSFAAGCVVGGLVAKSGSAKKFKEVAAEKAGQLKSATKKAAAAVREEFSSKEEETQENV